MLAPCVLNPVNKRLWKVFNLLYRMMSQKMQLFQPQLSLLLFLFFIFFQKVQLSLCAKQFLGIQHRRHSSCPRIENCIQLLSLEPFFMTRKYFFYCAYGPFFTELYCMCNYVLSWSIYHKEVFSPLFPPSEIFCGFQFACDELHFQNRENLLRDTERIWRFFPPRKATFLFTRKLVILT